MVSGGSCGLLGPGLWCCWVRTMLLHRRPRSQSAQECGRGSSGNNVQRSYAILDPTRCWLVLLSSRRKQENWWAEAQKSESVLQSAGGGWSVNCRHNPTKVMLVSLGTRVSGPLLHHLMSVNSLGSMSGKLSITTMLHCPLMVQTATTLSSYKPAFISRLSSVTSSYEAWKLNLCSCLCLCVCDGLWATLYE